MNRRDHPTRTLITGASGFIGSQVVRASLDRGDEVVAVVRSRSRAAHLINLSDRLELVEAELGDRSRMRRVAAESGAGLAVHLAWAIGPDYLDTAENLTCVGGSLAMLEGLVEGGCKRVVMVGSHLELQPGAADLDDDEPATPQSLYAVCKDSVHRIARSFVAGTETSLAWARLFNVYGPGQPDWALVSHIIRHLLDGRRCAMTQGDQERVFLHVRDVAEAIVDIGYSPVEGNVHVGSREPVTVRSLAARIGEQLGRPELLAFGEAPAPERIAPRIVPSCARLYDDIGFRPRWSLEEGLADTIAWWRARRRSAVAT